MSAHRKSDDIMDIFLSGWTRKFSFAFFGAIGFIVAMIIAEVSGYGIGPALSLATAADRTTELMRREVAFGLASLIAVIGFSVMTAYLMASVILPIMIIGLARRRIQRPKDDRAFAAEVDAITQDLEGNPFVGAEWGQYERTLRRSHEGGRSSVLHATSRPSAFINMQALRDNVPSLKMMGPIPGYFVGLGLLLTFVGLVLALSKAGQAVSGSDAQAMQVATRELLQTATFKFSSSIAGLGTSIVLSIVFRLASHALESSLHKLNKAIEARVAYDSSASLTMALREISEEQLTQLKELNSAAFAQRLGEQLSSPMAAIAAHVESGSKASAQTADRLHAIASGEFARSIGEGIAPFVSESIERSMDGVTQAVAQASRQTSSDAASNVEDLLMRLSNGVESRAEDALSTTAAALSEMRQAISEVATQLSGSGRVFRQSVKDDLSALTARTSEAADSIAERTAEAASAAANMLEGSVRRLDDALNGAVDRLERALANAAIASGAHASALNEVSARSLDTATAFKDTATNLKGSADPISAAAESLRGILIGAADVIINARDAIREHATSAAAAADSISAHNETLADTWRSYAGHLQGADASLAASVDRLGKATLDHQKSVNDHVANIDGVFAKAVDRLGSTIGSIAEASQDIAEEVGRMRSQVALATGGAP